MGVLLGFTELSSFEKQPQYGRHVSLVTIMAAQAIPIHDFSVDDDSSISFKLIPLEKKTEYDTSVAHRHNYYEIFFFEQGGGIHDIDFSTFKIANNSVHYVSPGQVHRVERELGSYGYVILFSREFYYMNLNNKNILYELPFLNNNSPKPLLNLSQESFAELFALARSMEKEYHSTNSLREEVIRSYLNILFAQSARLFSEEGFKEELQNELFQRFRILLENNFKQWHKVSDYAAGLNVTEKYLSDYMRKAVGQTALDLIHDRIVLEAKRLLRYSEHSVKEIAHFLNYDDPSHFSKFFRNRAHVSPNDFREA